MASVRDEINDMLIEMNVMRDDVKYLRGKCNLMEKSMQKKQSGTDSGLEEMLTNFCKTVDL